MPPTSHLLGEPETTIDIFINICHQNQLNAPCMEYLPTFSLECGHFSPNVGKYSLHGASGLLKGPHDHNHDVSYRVLFGYPTPGGS